MWIRKIRMYRFNRQPVRISKLANPPMLKKIFTGSAGSFFRLPA